MALRLRFDFYQIVATNGDTSALLNHVLTKWSSLPREHDDRILPRNNKSICLHCLEAKGNLWFGDFVGVGTGRPAIKAHVRGDMTNIPMAPDEGLGEVNSFLIDPLLKVLVLQSNRSAATSTTVIRLFQKLTLGMGQLELRPILSPSGIDRFHQMKTVSTFRVNIAKMDFSESMRKANRPLGQMVDFAESVQAPKLSFELTVGKQWRRKGLSVENLWSFVREMFAAEEGNALEIEKAEIIGHDEDDELSVLDLTEERLKVIVNTEPDDGRGLSQQTRWRLLYDAYNKHEAFLGEHFTRQH